MQNVNKISLSSRSKTLSAYGHTAPSVSTPHNPLPSLSLMKRIVLYQSGRSLHLLVFLSLSLSLTLEPASAFPPRRSPILRKLVKWEKESRSLLLWTRFICKPSGRIIVSAPKVGGGLRCVTCPTASFFVDRMLRWQGDSCAFPLLQMGICGMDMEYVM
jgi:hypothetical protein